MKSYLVKLLSSGFLSGMSPRAPGTMGTLSFLVLYSLLVAGTSPDCVSLEAQLAISVVVTLIALWSTDLALKSQTFGDSGDPKQIVIDEWAGMSVALIGSGCSIIEIVLAFLLFRLFDISKIYPVSAAENLPGTWGVTLDDLVAGALAAILRTAIVFLVL